LLGQMPTSSSVCAQMADAWDSSTMRANLGGGENRASDAQADPGDSGSDRVDSGATAMPLNASKFAPYGPPKPVPCIQRHPERSARAISAASMVSAPIPRACRITDRVQCRYDPAATPGAAWLRILLAIAF
jgi:hypothetical protein